ncbi:hypothetical protein KSS87_020690, partial [Heliosperma pusillum]
FCTLLINLSPRNKVNGLGLDLFCCPHTYAPSQSLIIPLSTSTILSSLLFTFIPS